MVTPRLAMIGCKEIGLGQWEHDQVDHAAADEAEAFESLVAEHRDRLMRLAYRLMGWAGDPEDIVQEVFVSAWKHRKRFRGVHGNASTIAWLNRITINKCRSHHRWARLRRVRSLASSHDEPPAESDGPSDLAEQVDTYHAVRRAMRRLAERDREVLVLHYLQELPVEEIALLLKVRRGTVSVRLHRARMRLRTLIDTEQED